LEQAVKRPAFARAVQRFALIAACGRLGDEPIQGPPAAAARQLLVVAWPTHWDSFLRLSTGPTCGWGQQPKLGAVKP
jgi:hypothetical protein